MLGGVHPRPYDLSRSRLGQGPVGQVLADLVSRIRRQVAAVEHERQRRGAQGAGVGEVVALDHVVRVALRGCLQVRLRPECVQSRPGPFLVDQAQCRALHVGDVVRGGDQIGARAGSGQGGGRSWRRGVDRPGPGHAPPRRLQLARRPGRLLGLDELGPPARGGVGEGRRRRELGAERGSAEKNELSGRHLGTSAGRGRRRSLAGWPARSRQV